MATDLRPGKVRVYAAAGVGGLAGGRWHDVTPSPRLDGWIRAGLVKTRGPHDETPPDRIPVACCGSRR